MSELFNGIKFAGVGSYDSGSTEMIRGSKKPTKNFNDNDDVQDVAKSPGGDYLDEHGHHWSGDGHSRGHTHTHTCEGGHTHTHHTDRIGVGAVCQIEGIPCVDGYCCINGRCAVPAIPHNSGTSTIGPGGVCQIGGILCVSGHTAALTAAVSFLMSHVAPIQVLILMSTGVEVVVKLLLVPVW